MVTSKYIYLERIFASPMPMSLFKVFSEVFWSLGTIATCWNLSSNSDLWILGGEVKQFYLEKCKESRVGGGENERSWLW